ncbi:MAG: class I SAM-dependent methyltransferase [Clostridia bacterium]|nr:class I SAM-dependent methyltransferase [Clostridia bacterium]
MKPNYKNWVPKGMVISYLAGTVISLVMVIVFGCLGFKDHLKWAIVLFVIFIVLSLFLIVVSVFMLAWHMAFSYNGTWQFSRRIIEKTADKVIVPEYGKCLDVGTGSGALAIAVAKRNPNAEIIGIDRWGKDYASFSKLLCEDNAKVEGVKNVKFEQGDALSLPFANESFDAVTSNYVYHNIPSKDRQKILLETLRVLKKGGTFAIHDLFTKQKYGDMEEFKQKLLAMGYEKVDIIDTTKNEFMTEKEAKYLFLSGSALLIGKK